MRIGVVADTHSNPLPEQMLEDFKKVDLIIHAGDFCDQNVLQRLQDIKDVKAVYGNMDGNDLRGVFPRKQILHLGSFQIGLFHGEGPPRTILDIVAREFHKTKVDAVIFGHSHQPFNEVIEDVLFFNPGSACDTIYAPYRSYGILELNDKITGKIIRIK